MARQMDADKSSEGLNEITALALGALAEAHATLLQYVKRRLRNENDAEDVMQRVYLRVLERGSQIKKKESVRSWLRHVLESALIDHHRRILARERMEADVARKDVATPATMENADAVICLCLYNLLPLLKPEYAQVLRQVDLEDQRREEVAAKLGLTLGNLTVRLHRARQALQRALELSCETCPIHGYLDCGCEYTKKLRSRPPRDDNPPRSSAL